MTFWLFRGRFPSFSENTALVVTKMDHESALLASINAKLQETIEKMRLAFNSSRSSVICMKTVNKLFQNLHQFNYFSYHTESFLILD